MPEVTAADPFRLETSQLKAVLWDMDGTLVDTEPYWMAGEAELAGRFGLEWTHEDQLSLVGQSLPNAARMLQNHGVKMEVREIIDFLLPWVIGHVGQHVPWQPGARELLDDLHSHGVRNVLVTMSETPLAAAVVDALPKPYFEHMVTGDKVTHGKPDPEAYLAALEYLREEDPTLEPSNMLVIEDSIPGVTAGLAAGFHTLGVPHMMPLPDFGSGYSTWDSLEGRSAADLEAVLSQAVDA